MAPIAPVTPLYKWVVCHLCEGDGRLDGCICKLCQGRTSTPVLNWTKHYEFAEEHPHREQLTVLDEHYCIFRLPIHLWGFHTIEEGEYAGLTLQVVVDDMTVEGELAEEFLQHLLIQEGICFHCFLMERNALEADFERLSTDVTQHRKN